MKRFRDQKSNTIRLAGKKLLMSTAALAMSLSATLPAFAVSDSVGNPGYPYPLPKKFYVSTAGDNSDGLSWATAWNEMDQIQWSQISAQNHDSLVIDGGTTRMIYRKSLSVQVAPYYSPINISVSTESGHSGQAVIAPGSGADGIVITGGGIYLNGSKRNGLYVYGAKNGLNVSTGAPYPFNIKNIEISHCTEAGLTVNASYYPVPMSQLIVHDNATNVVAKQNYAPGGASLSKCWIYNSTYRANSDGIRVDGNVNGPPMPGVSLNSCVIGPGLRDGLNNLSSARPTLTNCLLINSTRNNISSYSITLQNVTSFMTRLNPSESAHSCIKLQSTGTPYYQIGSIVNKTIVFGGMVEIPTTISYPYPPGSTQPFPITVDQNTQFRTTGNTTVLAPAMVNPMFASPVGLLPNITPVPILMGMDFSLRPESPAAGTGSSVTSVKNLLSTFD